VISFQAASGAPLAGLLRYSRADMGFSFETASLPDLAARVGHQGVSSLVIDTLQLEVGVETGQVLYAWGYCPESSWLPAVLKPPTHSGARIVAIVDPPLEEAVSVSISRSPWKIQVDRDSEWVLISPSEATAERVVEVADGILLGLAETKLNSIWLRPRFED
jgi:hypothetical protein